MAWGIPGMRAMSASVVCLTVACESRQCNKAPCLPAWNIVVRAWPCRFVPGGGRRVRFPVGAPTAARRRIGSAGLTRRRLSCGRESQARGALWTRFPMCTQQSDVRSASRREGDLARRMPVDPSARVPLGFSGVLGRAYMSVDSARMTMSTSLFSSSRMTCR